MKYLHKDYNVKLIEINFIVLSIQLYLFRTTIPFLKFPFLIFLFILLVYTMINYRSQIRSALREFIRNFYLVILLVIYFAISFFLSNKMNLVIFKDLTNSIVLLFLFFLLTVFVTSKSDLDKFYSSVVRFIVLFGLLISVILVSNFLNVFTLPEGGVKDSPGLFSLSGSITTDYNFALVPVFFGMIGLFFLLMEQTSLLKKGIYNLILIFFSLSIFFSGSRRGLIVISVILFVLFVVFFISLFSNNIFQKKTGKRTAPYILSMLLLALLIAAFVLKGSYDFKNKSLESFGSKNITSTKVKFATAIFRYASIFDKNINFPDIYERIWFNGYDKALDPDTGWGTRVHKTVFPLTGDNYEILPAGAKGYLLDNNSDADTILGNIVISTELGNHAVKKGNIVFSSIYCYISNDFNGDRIQLYSGGATFGNQISEGLDRVPEQISSDSTGEDYGRSNLIENGDFTNGLIHWVPNADSTTHEIIDTPFGKGVRVSRTDGDGGYWSLRYAGRPVVFNAGHRYQIKFNFKVEKGADIPFNIGWWANDAENGFSAFNLPVTVRDLGRGWKEATCSYEFRITHYDVPFFLNSLQDFSIVDISGVELKDLDRIESIPSFIDQLGLINLSNRGVWRKINLESECNDGLAPVFVSISKYGAIDTSLLNGYVIFAYPQYKIINKTDSVLSYMIDNNIDNINNIDYANRLKAPAGFNIPNLHLKYSATGNNKLSAVFLSPLFQLITILRSAVIDRDPIRNLASRLIPDDTTYFGYKNDLIVDTVKNKFVGERLMRWQFALQIFTKEYNWRQKITGGGFNFMNWYGFYFMKDKNYSDYPHNPLLSVLLYSGIFGLILYIIFLFQAFYYYLKYLRQYYIFFIFFVLTFFFSFFSAGSPFDPPIMGFFSILPFFLNYIKEKSD